MATYAYNNLQKVNLLFVTNQSQWTDTEAASTYSTLTWAATFTRTDQPRSQHRTTAARAECGPFPPTATITPIKTTAISAAEPLCSKTVFRRASAKETTRREKLVTTARSRPAAGRTTLAIQTGSFKTLWARRWSSSWLASRTFKPVMLQTAPTTSLRAGLLQLIAPKWSPVTTVTRILSIMTS